ncbi:sigma-70 family RNA polymerase sigma factor [Leptolyngbya ohadii]|uniref:sigma-70 family RNA polymerase sigma factor n=1 Tax=Leptolyngbya ohadii TaxID=1962290 RepID=UPI000B599EFE|nr:sigma-70 family RNA polymerase sigma factor [Leptolyngbya ohadii]
MQPRFTIVQIFSTFAQFEADRFSRWVTNARLRHNVERLEPEVGAESEEFWILYWYRQRQQSAFPGEHHLAAYVQEACYWAAHRMGSSRIGSSRIGSSNSDSGELELPDRFQVAIATLPKVLEGYRPEQGASLKTYALLSFSNTIRDRLRHQQELGQRTDWGLLRKVSQKCLTESLRAAGLSQETIAKYQLAWTGFKRLYLPTTTATRQLTAPDAETWQAIAAFYKQQRSEIIDPETIDPETIEGWLKVCAKQIRAYLSPPVTSLNLQKFDDGMGEIQDDLPDPASSPMELLISQEELRSRQEQKMQIRKVLAETLTTLDPPMQTLLQLYYQQNLTQQHIAQRLDVKQYTVSRRLSSAKEILLKAIVRWSQTTLHISLTSPAVQQMSLVLEEWLQMHYQTAPWQEES